MKRYAADTSAASSRSPARAAPRSAKHTPHYYLGLAGYLSAVAVLVLNLWAYYDESLVPTRIGFAATAVATAILLITWFWGVFLLMNGLILKRRLLYLLFHATLGSISPLFYTVNIGMQMNSLVTQPVSDIEIGLDFAALIALTVQLISGWVMLQRGPWRMASRRQ